MLTAEEGTNGCHVLPRSISDIILSWDLLSRSRYTQLAKGHLLRFVINDVFNLNFCFISFLFRCISLLCKDPETANVHQT